MDFKQILMLLGREQVPGDETISGLLADAVANFSTNPANAIGAIRQLQAKDPSGLVLAAMRLLVAAEEKSPGLQYIAGLLTAGNLLVDLIDPLLDERVLPLEVAVPLARRMAAVELLLDVHLVRKMMANAGGDVGAIKSATALHVLGLVGAISDCSRLTSYLVQLLRHPSAKVRSKAALLVGRANWNLTRVKSLLAADDGRVRANAVESLWGHRDSDVLTILWGATKDPCGRVVVNALLGLCQAGDREAYSRVAKLAEAANPALRSGAAWAMGETGDPEFGATLENLERDGDAKVRAMAEKSRKKLRPPDANE
jgi:hypothetical protein